jgi:hypothetical protein
MASAIVKTLKLDSGCRVEMADVSRKQIGDRWIVTLEVRMHIPVIAAVLEPAGPEAPDIEAVQAMLGDTAVFVQRKEKIFVDDSDRETVFETLCRQFEEGPMAYLRNPRFPGRFLIKQYEEKRKRSGRS